MAGAQSRTYCRMLFQQLEILPVQCQYIISIMNFIISVQEIFQTNSSVHNINTCNKHHLHRPNANLCIKKKKVHFMLPSEFSTFTIYSGSPQECDKVKLKVALRKYLNTPSFQCINEVLCVKIIYSIVLKFVVIFHTV